MRKISLAATVAACSLCLVACSEKSPTTEQHDHFEADGWVIVDDEFDVLYHVWRGQSQDTLFVHAGCESPHLQVRFLTEDSVLVSGPDDADHGMSWTLGDSTIANIERHEGDVWDFHLVGVQEGSTTLKLQIMHGDHADVSTPFIPVVIKEAVESCEEQHDHE